MKILTTSEDDSPIKQSFAKRWLATLVTIPIAAVLLLLGAISTGAGHGTTVILKFLYAPIYLLQVLDLSSLSFLDFAGPAIGIMIFGGLHLTYSLLADYLRRINKGIIYLCLIFTVHYCIFIYAYVSDEEDQAKLSKVLELDTDRTFLLLPVVLFVCWQIFLLVWSNSKSVTTQPYSSK